MTAKVLITGAGSGIGLAVARRVVARGMRAILWDISAAALQAAQDELGDSAEVRQVDVSDVQAVTGAAASLEGVSHLVNNNYNERHLFIFDFNLCSCWLPSFWVYS